jgi:hypothetical protein
MRNPTTHQEAQAIIDSGDLRHLLKLQLIIIAFGDIGTVGFKAIMALLEMPEDDIENWASGLNNEELEQAEQFATKMIDDILEHVRDNKR